MDKFISLIPDWAIGIGVLILAIGFLLAVIGSFILLFRKNLIFKNISLTDKQSKLNNQIQTIALTPDSLILAFDKSLETQFAIDRMEFRERLKEQMLYTEDKITEIKEKVLQAHRHLLIAKGISVSIVHTHPTLSMFEELIDGMLGSLKSEMRERFHEIHHLFSKEDNTDFDFNFIKSEYNLYMFRVIDTLISLGRGCISKRWIDNELVNRRESWDAMNSKIDEVSCIIQDILTKGIQIQLKYDKKISKLKAEKNNYIKSIIKYPFNEVILSDKLCM